MTEEPDFEFEVGGVKYFGGFKYMGMQGEHRVSPPEQEIPPHQGLGAARGCIFGLLGTAILAALTGFAIWIAIGGMS